MATGSLVRRIAWYPALLALVFLLYPLTVADIAPSDAARLLVIGVVLALVATVVATVLIDRDRGAVAAAILLVGCTSADSALQVFLLVVAIALVVTEHRLWSARRISITFPWARLTELLTLSLAIVLGIQLVLAVQLRAVTPSIATSPAWAGAPAGDRPDIYILLADGHGRADVLEGAYGMDLADLRSGFGDAGLVESANSHANHTSTVYTLSVLLNGRPLSELGQDLRQPADHSLEPAALRDSGVFHALRGSGYRIIALDSGYSDPRLRGADEVIDVGPRNEYERTILGETAFGVALDGGSDANRRSQGERVLREVDEVARLAAVHAAGPRFVFVHLPSPHVPYVLDARCELIDPVGLPEDLAVARLAPLEVRVAAEREQTTCVDRLLVDTVAKVVAAQPEAVVIVMSDHGPDELFDAGSPAEPGTGYRFANLFWARVPGHPNAFPDDVTTVNVFPILFNDLWGADLPMHPDDLYLGPSRVDGRFTRYQPLEWGVRLGHIARSPR